MMELKTAEDKGGLKFTKLDRTTEDSQSVLRTRTDTGLNLYPAAHALTSAQTALTPEALQGEPQPQCGTPLYVFPPHPPGSNECPQQQGGPAQPAGGTPTVVASAYYSAGFLKNFIGYRMRVEFVLGTNGSLGDRNGTLRDVGASYIVLQPTDTDDLLMCDLYSIKFVTIFG